MSSNVNSPLRMSQSESRINKHSLLIFIKGNVSCAWYSHLHQALDTQRFQALNHCFLDWTKPATSSLIWGTLTYMEMRLPEVRAKYLCIFEKQQAVSRRFP
jgi:hypothetical protein